MVSLFLMDLVLDNLTLSRTRLHLQQKNTFSNRFEMCKKRKERAPFCLFEKQSVSKMSRLFFELLSCPMDYRQHVINPNTTVSLCKVGLHNYFLIHF